MYRSGMKIVAFAAIMFALIFTTWHIYVPKYVRARMEPELYGINNIHVQPSVRTNAELASLAQTRTFAIGGSNNRSRTLTSGSKGDTYAADDSVFPFDDDRSYSEGPDVQNIPEIKADDGVNSKHPTEHAILSNNSNINNNHRMKTFFTSLEKTFNDITIGPDNGIPTLPFLDACDAISKLFSRMNRMVLHRVVQDIAGNIEKIQKNYDMWPEDSGTLQEMVLRELDIEELEERFTTIGLTWLKRAFEFISTFLSYMEQEKEQSAAARRAYDETLRKHHGIFARGAFAAGFMTLSTKQAFLHDLASNKSDVHRPDFERIAMEDAREYNEGLQTMLKILRDFFTENEIEN